MTEANQQQGQAHSLDSLLAFYQQANGAFRTALLIVVLWPLAALAAAMIFHGGRAQTIVPIIDMLPLGAVLFVIIGAPFGLAVLFQHPFAKKGFIFLIGLIGIELAIGVYLAVIPLSSDNGLVPLLMLGSMALFFLWVAKFARPLRILLTLCLVIVTVVFIVGGRPSFSSAIKTAFTPLTRHDYATQDFPTFTIPVESDLWTQEVTMPRTWAGFNLTVNRNFDDPSADNPWFAYRCSGTSGELIDTGSIYKAGQTYPDALLASCKGPMQFRGHANIVFERTRSAEKMTQAQNSQPPSTVSASVEQPATPPQTPQSIPLPPPPKQLTPDWEHAQRQEEGDFVVVAAPCIVRGANLQCSFLITNQGKEKDVEILSKDWKLMTRMIDEQGVEYQALKVSLGSSQDASRGKATLPTGVQILGDVTFGRVTGTRVALLELLVCRNLYYVDAKVSLRDLAIQREEP
jgi:hypothetical protein